jgi:hypothetical protein
MSLGRVNRCLKANAEGRILLSNRRACRLGHAIDFRPRGTACDGRCRLMCSGCPLISDM